MSGDREIDSYFISASEARGMIEQALEEERGHIFRATIGMIKDFDRRLKKLEKALADLQLELEKKDLEEKEEG